MTSSSPERSYAYWTAKELRFLRRFYKNIENDRLAVNMALKLKTPERSVASVVTKAHRLRLKKSRRLIREIASSNILRRYENRLAG